VAADKTKVGLDQQLIPIVTKSLRIFVVVFGSLIAFQNLGINVMSLVAGLGLGGLAFALAAKDTAANLFGSVMIFSDSPFRVGDWVKFGGVEGTVEQVGFRSTKVRTFYNSLITVPNAVVASAAVDNMGRRQYRRVYTKLAVTYGTSPDEMEAFLEGIKNIIKANPTTRKDYFHVIFSGYGDSALEVMVYFFLEVPDWGQELIQRQNIYLEILRLAKELKVSFAFPSQSLYVESLPLEKKPRGSDPMAKSDLVELAKEFGKEGSKARPGGCGIFTPPFLET
jgi:MscS family membrane protein